MNDLARTTPLDLRAPGAQPYQTTHYAAFRLDERRTQPLRVDDQSSLTAALNSVLPLCIHKEKLAIRETDDVTGKTVLHLYAIKRKSAANYVWEGHRQVRVQTLYAEPLCSFDGDVVMGERA